MAKQFKNDNFWQDFQNRLQDTFEDLPDRLDNIKEMIEDAIYEYRFNSDVQRAYKMVVQLDGVMEKMFDGLNNKSLDEEQLTYLTDLCRKINEDLVFQEIRDSQYEESKVNNGSNKKKGQVKSGQTENLVAEKEVVTEKKDSKDSHKKDSEDIGKDIGKEQSISPTKDHSNKELTNATKKVSDINDISLNLVSTDNTSADVGKKIEHKEKDTKNVIPVEVKEEKSEALNQVPKTTKIDIRKQFDDILDLLNHNYPLHKLEDAYEQLVLLRGIRKSDGLDKEVKDHIESVFKKNDELFEQMDGEFKDLSNMIFQLGDEEGWNKEKVQKDVIIKYKRFSDNTIALRIEGNVEVPIFNVLCMVNEPDAHPLWIPYCAKSVELKRIHRASKALYQKWGFPFPLQDRESYVLAMGVDRLDRNGSVLICEKSFHEHKSIQEKLQIIAPEKGKHVKMDIFFRGTEITPIGKNKVRMRCITRMNAHIQLIPMSLINFMTRKAALHILEKLTKKAKTLKGSKWEEKIQANREFYNWLEGRVESFLKDHGLLN
jgi:hypothetical protein